jgi:hypothetical protein
VGDEAVFRKTQSQAAFFIYGGVVLLQQKHTHYDIRIGKTLIICCQSLTTNLCNRKWKPERRNPTVKGACVITLFIKKKGKT